MEDSVAQMRRRLQELLADSGRQDDPAGTSRRATERVRATGGSVAQGTMGIRSDASDPQRKRPTDSRYADSADGCAADFGDNAECRERTDQNRGADPVAAGSGGTAEQAKEACLRLLAVRARSRAELAKRLADKGFATSVVEGVLDRLAEVNLVDDASFAEQWVRARHTFSGKGKQVLAQELRRKGVDQQDAAEALATITADDEETRATELVLRKLRSMPRDLDRDKAIRRLVGMLARRGYPQSIAYSVVKRELAAHRADVDTDDDLVAPDE